MICGEYALLYLLFGVKGREIYAFTLPLVVIFFYHALRYPQLGQGSLFASIGRNYSAYIYIIHMMVGTFLEHMFVFGTPFGKCVFAMLVFVGSLIINNVGEGNAVV